MCIMMKLGRVETPYIYIYRLVLSTKESLRQQHRHNISGFLAISPFLTLSTTSNSSRFYLI